MQKTSTYPPLAQVLYGGTLQCYCCVLKCYPLLQLLWALLQRHGYVCSPLSLCCFSPLCLEVVKAGEQWPMQVVCTGNLDVGTSAKSPAKQVEMCTVCLLECRSSTVVTAWYFQHKKSVHPICWPHLLKNVTVVVDVFLIVLTKIGMLFIPFFIMPANVRLWKLKVFLVLVFLLSFIL